MNGQLFVKKLVRLICIVGWAVICPYIKMLINNSHYSLSWICRSSIRSICKSIYSLGHAIRLSNVRHHPPESTPSSWSENWFLQRKRKPDVAWGLVVQDETKRLRFSEKRLSCQLCRGWKLGRGFPRGWIWRVWNHWRGVGGRARGGRGLKPSKTTLSRYLS